MDQNTTDKIRALPIEQITESVVSIQVAEIWFLVALGAISAIFSGSRAVRDSEYFTVAKLLAFSVTSGAVSIATVAFVGYACGDLLGNWLLLLGVAITVGIMGRPAEEILKQMLQQRFKKAFDNDSTK